ncbi:hypothetical protein Dimus_009611 [Dionaea muscipula]
MKAEKHWMTITHRLENCSHHATVDASPPVPSAASTSSATTASFNAFAAPPMTTTQWKPRARNPDRLRPHLLPNFPGHSSPPFPAVILRRRRNHSTSEPFEMEKSNRTRHHFAGEESGGVRRRLNSETSQQIFFVYCCDATVFF